jgi:hypothetical protein
VLKIPAFAKRQTVVAMLDLLAAKKITTENNDIFRVTIKYKRIKSYHFVLTVSNHNRILTYQMESEVYNFKLNIDWGLIN